MSRLSALYDSTLAFLCGRHPDLMPWHFQWLFLREVHPWQRARMQRLSGRVLDVGCGEKPYANWVDRGDGGVTEYVGLDVGEGANTDIVVGAGEPWPLEDASFDAVLFTQVLEHVAEFEHVIREISRVLKPGGTLLFTVPFLMPAHGVPHDFQRFTIDGVRHRFETKFDIAELVPLGRAGAVIGNLFLTLIENSMNASRLTRMLKGALLPLWIGFSLAVNLICVLLDQFDRTGTHYANVAMLARRKSSP